MNELEIDIINGLLKRIEQLEQRVQSLSEDAHYHDESTSFDTSDDWSYLPVYHHKFYDEFEVK